MKDLSKTTNLSRYSVLRQILGPDTSRALKQVVSEFSGIRAAKNRVTLYRGSK